jgi:NOL1/NOP2/sun family putative RNA methylase
MEDQIPENNIVKPKDAFVERYKEILGKRYDEFIKYSYSYIRKCIRVNTLKISVSDLKKRLSNWELTPVPWCKEGFWIKYKDEKRFDIGNTPEHQLGYIYVQDAASMIPPVVLFKNGKSDLVLDIAAAPGSKASQIAQYMNNNGLLIANDSAGMRLKALGINLQRCGMSNTIITHCGGHHFKRLGLEFDKILVDAPCSGTGTIRRSMKTMSMWSPHLVRKMVGVQKQLLESGFNVLKKNGVLVYSTCTMEPEENEGVVSWLLEKYPDAKLDEIKLNIKKSSPILEFDGKKYNREVRKCLRIYHQDNDTEGFFVARIRKI